MHRHPKLVSHFIECVNYARCYGVWVPYPPQYIFSPNSDNHTKSKLTTTIHTPKYPVLGYFYADRIITQTHHMEDKRKWNHSLSGHHPAAVSQAKMLVPILYAASSTCSGPPKSGSSNTVELITGAPQKLKIPCSICIFIASAKP